MEKNKKVIRDYIFIIVGSFLISVASLSFFDKVELVIGGVTGVAIIIRYLFSVPLWLSNTVINIPLFIWGFFANSRSQYAEAIKISEADLQPGDLIFYGSSPSTIYHVGIYSGNGTIIHATRTGDFVREHDYHYAKAYGFGRYIRK